LVQEHSNSYNFYEGFFNYKLFIILREVSEEVQNCLSPFIRMEHTHDIGPRSEDSSVRPSLMLLDYTADCISQKV
jgi:hypothetical protein